MRIVVVGGTGLIGSKVVTRLSEHGHEAVNASPSTGVNSFTGDGLSEALKDADVVVDVSNSPSFEAAAALTFFETATGNLLAAEATAGVKHHVALSVVGVDRMPNSGYMRAKLTQENLIRRSSIPYSMVHATQFFEFVMNIADAATDGDTVRLAPVRVRPMAADDVAEAVEQISDGPPRNATVELGGPQEFHLNELIRQALKAHGDPRHVVTDVRAPYFGAQLSERTLVPGAGARLGLTRFEDWLDNALADQM